MIRKCSEADHEDIYAIVNDAAQAYKGNIPPDMWHDPYMSKEELKREIGAGVVFWGYEEDGRLAGVMGLQDVKDVTLVRHAYVRTKYRNRGIGGLLLKHLLTLTQRPTLVGTWAGAWWAVRFYEKNGYLLVTPVEKDALLKEYWNIPERQIETSVVLADAKWRNKNENRKMR
jgi:GNAT superfamily N-acetyltransferase